MIKFSVESLHDCLEELEPLLKEHHKEIALYQDRVPFNPDYERYLDLEESGELHTVVAREDGKVVGYYMSFLVPHIHYKDTLYAINDVVYLEPRVRHSSIAQHMIEYVEENLKELGVSVITLHMKTYLPFEGLARKLGFEKVEYIYSKYVGKE